MATVDELDGWHPGDRVDVCGEPGSGTIVSLEEPYYAFVMMDYGRAIDALTDNLTPA